MKKAGWQAKTLGDVCHVYQPETLTQKQLVPGKCRVYGANGQIGWHNCFNHEEPQLILGCRGSCGTVHVTEPRSWINGNAMVVQPKSGVMDISFLAYALKGGIDLALVITGTAQPQITRTSLMPLGITFPESIVEQRRIVAILDEAFDGIATAKANAEKNLQNARALFESHLQSVFTERGEGWQEKALGEVCDFENGDRGKNYPNRNEYVEAGVPWINTGHIQPDGTLSESEMNFITEEKFTSLRSGKIQVGDLVYCLRGATLGKTALVEPLTVGAVASSLVILRPKNSLDSRFLYYYLSSPIGREAIKTYENGAAQPNLGAKSVAKFRINLPCISVQKEIALKFDDIRRETQRLESIYQKKLAALDDLKKSLLHQAFSGKL